MSYLFGDSTPSSLEVNFIDVLREGTDFCVQLALSTDGLLREGERGEALRQAARSNNARLESLGQAVASAVQSFCNGEGDGPVARCALAILKSTSDLVKNEVQAVSSSLELEEAKVEEVRASHRQRSVSALEALLLQYDLPDSSASLHLEARASGPYAVELRTTTPLGVAATMEVDVPPSHLFGHVARVDRIVDRLEVQAPEMGGWLHKEEKLRPQRLEKLLIIGLDLGAGESAIRLRAAADGSGPGFDIRMNAEGPRVTLKRVAERDGSLDTPFEVDAEDAEKLLALLQKLEASSQELIPHRKALRKASLDDRPLGEHDAPTLLVERFIQAIAPVVREIAARSPSTTEFVLKRLVGGGRREEIFVAKSELREKLEPLPSASRALFDPLGFGDGRPVAQASSQRPPPLPSQGAAPRGKESFAPAPARRAPEASEAEPVGPPGGGWRSDATNPGFRIVDVQGEKRAAE